MIKDYFIIESILLYYIYASRIGSAIVDAYISISRFVQFLVQRFELVSRSRSSVDIWRIKIHTYARKYIYIYIYIYRLYFSEFI